MAAFVLGSPKRSTFQLSLRNQRKEGANKIKQTAWWWSPFSSTITPGESKQDQADSLVVVALFINYNTRWEQQHQADSLVVVGAQQQGGGVLSPLL